MILRVGFCHGHGCDFHQNADIGPDKNPPLTGQKLSCFCFEGMRSHHIEMAYVITSAARCTPQFWQIRQSFCFQAPRFRIGDGMISQHLPLPSTIVKQDAVCLSFCTLCICDAPPSQGESLGWQFHAWQSNALLDH